MTRPVRIQLSRAKGWRMPPNTVKVDRSTKWGNPFVVGSHIVSRDGGHAMTAAEAVMHFRTVVSRIDTKEEHAEIAKFFPLIDLTEIVRELRGKNLGCWCKIGDPCHADVLLELANA